VVRFANELQQLLGVIILEEVAHVVVNLCLVCFQRRENDARELLLELLEIALLHMLK
jgi:hypothetical protein